MARTAARRKEKRTYSLSADSVAYVGGLAERIHVTASEALDRLIQDRRAEEERARIDAQITAYYDSLSPEEQVENRLWGKFAESQFPRE